MSDFEKAMSRPHEFFNLSGERQWAIDKELGILDWDGGCNHGTPMCVACEELFNKHFSAK